MYQSSNTSNAKVSKSDLMALETDLSTCCPKEVKEAAAAASAPSPPPAIAKQPSSSVDNKIQKLKENKVSHPRPTAASKPSPQIQNNVYGQPQPQPARKLPASKRPKQQQTGQHVAATTPPWPKPQPSQLMPEYYGTAKRLPGPTQPTFPMSQPSVMYSSPQNALRTALICQQSGFLSPPIVSNTFSPQNRMVLYGGNASPAMPGNNDSEPDVLKWFKGVLNNLMETVKNIDNRLVFIRNSTSNLISQNEVSVLVSQLHNLLKISSSKLQEVDCDLLKSYKEFIDKSEITVNDFDDIIREFPEFFKPAEDFQTPESNEPEPNEEFNPLALVEVVDEGEQLSQPQPQQPELSKTGAVKQPLKADNNNCIDVISTEPNSSSNAPNSSGSSQSALSKSSNKPKTKEPVIIPCSVTIKKEIIPADEVSINLSNDKKSVGNGSKRKLDSEDETNNKIQIGSVRVKKEKIDEDGTSEAHQNISIKKCCVKLNNVTKTSISS